MMVSKKKPISEIRLANWKDAYLDNGRGTVSERKINVIQIPKRCAFYKYLFCRLENSIIRYIIYIYIYKTSPILILIVNLNIWCTWGEGEGGGGADEYFKL